MSIAKKKKRKRKIQTKNLKNQNLFELVCFLSLSYIDKVCLFVFWGFFFLEQLNFYFV